ncbi:MAG: substrate-binding domain-containing protein [Syntrophales bacterium]|nr:substrate-binding domain-containing protein [Syntrophales bacterium]
MATSGDAEAVFAGKKSILFVTTTSVQDSGLLDRLITVFEKKTGYFVKTIAVGSGQAISLGKRGEADVLLVHSPQEEEEFVACGFGINRKPVMYNDFVLVGPPNDPAKVKGSTSVEVAFKRIAASQALFLSRGDNSGTHAKERSIWLHAHIKVPGPKWYQETGLGMGHTLSVASEKRAYALTDRGTYLALKRHLDLVMFVAGGKEMENVYHVIEVNPAKWPKVNAKGGRALARFLLSHEAQGIIENYGKEKFGLPLFHPAR